MAPAGLLSLIFLASMCCCVFAATSVVHWGVDASGASITVAAGDTVTWILDEDAFPHTFTSQTLIFSSKSLQPGSHFSYTFSARGSYPYHCSYFPQDTRSIITVAPSLGRGNGSLSIPTVRANIVPPVKMVVTWTSTVSNGLFFVVLTTPSGMQLTQNVTDFNSVVFDSLTPNTTYSVIVTVNSLVSDTVYATTSFASTWSAAQSGKFSNSANWNANHPPCSSDFMLVSSPTRVVIEVDKNVGFRGLVAQPGVVFSMNPGVVIRVMTAVDAGYADAFYNCYPLSSDSQTYPSLALPSTTTATYQSTTQMTTPSATNTANSSASTTPSSAFADSC